MFDQLAYKIATFDKPYLSELIELINPMIQPLVENHSFKYVEIDAWGKIDMDTRYLNQRPSTTTFDLDMAFRF